MILILINFFPFDVKYAALILVTINWFELKNKNKIKKTSIYKKIYHWQFNNYYYILKKETNNFVR